MRSTTVSSAARIWPPCAYALCVIREYLVCLVWLKADEILLTNSYLIFSKKPGAFPKGLTQPLVGSFWYLPSAVYNPKHMLHICQRHALKQDSPHRKPLKRVLPFTSSTPVSAGSIAKNPSGYLSYRPISRSRSGSQTSEGGTHIHHCSLHSNRKVYRCGRRGKHVTVEGIKKRSKAVVRTRSLSLSSSSRIL